MSIFRNSFFNLLGQVFPMAVAFFAIPVAVNTFGLERFGLLSLSWMLLGYFAYLDMGLGRATVKTIADALGKGEHGHISGIVWSSFLLNLVFGLAGTALMLWGTPFLVHSVFNISSELSAEANAVFTLLAFSVPAITTTAALRAVFEALQRFDLVNVVKAPSNAMVFLIPLLAPVFHLDLPMVVLLMVLSRILTVFVYFLFLFWKMPATVSLSHISYGSLGSLVRYGGWVSISNVLTPVITYAERLFIAAMLPLGVLAYYTAPFEMISRFAIIPASVAQTLFPAFSAGGVRTDTAVANDLLIRPLKYLFFLLTPLAAFFVFFSPQILELWLGHEFRMQSTITLQILTLAFYFNSFAYIFLSAVQGLGRPDLKAKLDGFLTVLFLIGCWFLIKFFGIAGAATTKFIVFALDALVLIFFVKKILNYQLSNVLTNEIRGGAIISLVFLATGFIANALLISLSVKILIFILFSLLFVWFVWKLTFGETDRTLALNQLSKMLFFTKRAVE